MSVQAVGSTVNLVLRDYNRDETDLAVKVPGRGIAVTRHYENNRWQWGEERETIYSEGVAKPGSVLQIEKAGVLYNREAGHPESAGETGME